MWGWRKAANLAASVAKLAALRHPHILPVLDYGEVDGRAFLVYPAVAGGTLRQQLGQPLPPAQVVALLSPLAGALDSAAQQGLIHCHLKPRTILITQNGAPVLDDF